MTPKVTILIASYNRLSMLQGAVGSALNQSYRSFEVLIVDDGSNAATVAWLRSAASKEKRLRVQFQKNQGVATARQNGLLAARGELVCILDSDDRLVPHALEKICNVFETQCETDLVYCAYRSWIGNDSTVVRLPRCSSNREMLRKTFLRPVVPFKHSGTTFRRELARQIGGYDGNLRAKIDIDLFLKFLNANRRLVLLEEPLVEFCFHRDSISRRRWAGLKVWLQLIDRHGPRSRFRRSYYKLIRSAAEIGKYLYEVICLRLPASADPGIPLIGPVKREREENFRIGGGDSQDR